MDFATAKGRGQDTPVSVWKSTFPSLFLGSI
ncbi:hypothetical protein LINPERPRIM_LOCUS36267 [Linum perenne]